MTTNALFSHIECLQGLPKCCVLYLLPNTPFPVSNSTQTITYRAVRTNAASRQHQTSTCQCKSLLQRWGWDVLEHPSFKPDIIPWEFYLFTKMRVPLRPQRFFRPFIFCVLGCSVQTLSQTGTLNSNRTLKEVWKSLHQSTGDFIEAMVTLLTYTIFNSQTCKF